MKTCFQTCSYQNQNLSLVSHSCRSCSIRVARVALMSLVSHSRCSCLAIAMLNTPDPPTSAYVQFTHVRSSHRRCSMKKGVPKILQNSQENICVGVSFFIKLFLVKFIEHIRATGSDLYSKRFA